MPWVSRRAKGSSTLHQPLVAHQLGPETRVEQVQDGVLDAADVLIDRHPLVGALIDHGLTLSAQV
jgi:hypothetical protein